MRHQHVAVLVELDTLHRGLGDPEQRHP